MSQPAVSQQLKVASHLGEVHPETLIEAAGLILKQVAAERGFSRPAVFGSVARLQARQDSDIDLLVEAPAGTSISDMAAQTQPLPRSTGTRQDRRVAAQARLSGAVVSGTAGNPVDLTAHPFSRVSHIDFADRSNVTVVEFVRVADDDLDW